MADPAASAMTQGDINLAWADALIAGLASSGIRHAVISPGSRSTPLALAVHRHPALELTIIPDERSAAFFALGVGRRSGQPAIVICTSGTAVGNWLPAAIEGAMDAVPMVMLSADRPLELQHVGSNQTIEQPGLFSSHVRACYQLSAPSPQQSEFSFPESLGVQAAHRACWPEPGPVHINAAFREPMVPSLAALEASPKPVPSRPLHRPRIEADPESLEALAADLAQGPNLIVVGRLPLDDDFAEAVTTLAARLDCPIVADPLSGLRWGKHDRSRVISAHDVFLRSPGWREKLAPATVLQFGGSATGIGLQRFLQQAAHRLWLIGSFGPWADPARHARQRVYADPTRLARALEPRLPRSQSRDNRMADWAQAQSWADTLCADPEVLPPEGLLVKALEAGLPDGCKLFVGNSIAIRAVDAFARGRQSGLDVYGNRGASGIDGNVSTALGIATDESTASAALIGDLTLYHDMNGLLAARDRDITLIVVNNGGGGIFDLLPQRQMPDFERLWLTPTALDLAKVAALYDLRHAVAEPGPAFQQQLALACASPGPDLIELRIDRPDSSRRFRALWAAASAS
ncbi:MAG: 2-succinyl-5-enolpyruvyl-6-hydroxy-3-cyclohexene-1-carboxylic-acid synthase [Gammaproteobacteria bacterium]